MKNYFKFTSIWSSNVFMSFLNFNKLNFFLSIKNFFLFKIKKPRKTLVRSYKKFVKPIKITKKKIINGYGKFLKTSRVITRRNFFLKKYINTLFKYNKRVYFRNFKKSYIKSFFLKLRRYKLRYTFIRAAQIFRDNIKLKKPFLKFNFLKLFPLKELSSKYKFRESKNIFKAAYKIKKRKRLLKKKKRQFKLVLPTKPFKSTKLKTTKFIRLVFGKHFYLNKFFFKKPNLINRFLYYNNIDNQSFLIFFFKFSNSKINRLIKLGYIGVVYNGYSYIQNTKNIIKQGDYLSIFFDLFSLKEFVFINLKRYSSKKYMFLNKKYFKQNILYRYQLFFYKNMEYCLLNMNFFFLYRLNFLKYNY